MSQGTGRTRKPKPPAEKIVQRQVATLFRSVGCTVRTTSQYRASGITPGMPDLYVTHCRAKLHAWFEVKKPKAAGFDPFKPETWIPEVLRPEQLIFRAECIATGQHHFWGGVREAQAALVTLGLGEMRQGQFWLRAA